MDGLVRKIREQCGCIPHYFPQDKYRPSSNLIIPISEQNSDIKTNSQRNCSLPVHAECVTPLINAFKGSSNKCEKACDSRFYKQQTIMYGRLRRVGSIDFYFTGNW